MKKLFLAGAVALMGLVNAQEKAGFQGKTFVTGQLGFSNETDNNTDIEKSNYSALPIVGYFVSPTVAVGAGVGYVGTTTKTDNDNKVTNGGFTFVPMARKYWSVSKNLYIFGQLAAPMEWGKVSTTTAGKKADVDYSSYGVNVAPGLDYFLSSNWSIEATLGSFGYSTMKYDTKGSKSTDSYDFGVKLSEIKFGVKYVF